MSRNKVQFQKGLARAASTRPMEARSNATRRLSLGVGPRVLNVPIAAAKRIAS